jgi:hypothetical protein
MCDENDGLNKRITEQLLDCEEEKKDNLDTWTYALKELSEIKDAFKTDENENINMHEKTILDIGTDAVKPLYLALKFEPSKIVGINSEVLSIASEIEAQSKLFTKTKIGFHDCNFFNEETLEKICEQEGIVGKFDFVLISKTLHHLRTKECIAKKRDPKHECTEDENCCIYGFDEQAIFERLLELGKRVVVNEYYNATEPDDDKERGQGGYFTANEWVRVFRYLSENYVVQLVRPKWLLIGKNESYLIESIVRQVDTLCFYVQNKQEQ